MLSYFVALGKTSPWTLYRHMLLHMYLYTHVYMHTALSVREVRPKAGWLLQILLVYSGFLPFSCQSLLFIQSSRCLLRVYSCFFRVLQHVDTVFKLGVLLFFYVFMCWTGPEQTSVPAGRHPDTRRLPGETATEQPALRPAFEPTLPQSITGEMHS